MLFSIFNWRLSGIKLIVENYSKFIISKLKKANNKLINFRGSFLKSLYHLRKRKEIESNIILLDETICSALSKSSSINFFARLLSV